MTEPHQLKDLLMVSKILRSFVVVSSTHNPSSDLTCCGGVLPDAGGMTDEDRLLSSLTASVERMLTQAVNFYDAVNSLQPVRGHIETSSYATQFPAI